MKAIQTRKEEKIWLCTGDIILHLENPRILKEEKGGGGGREREEEEEKEEEEKEKHIN